jgi:hypothetical protein
VPFDSLFPRLLGHREGFLRNRYRVQSFQRLTHNFACIGNRRLDVFVLQSGLNKLRKKDDLYRWEKEERTSGPKGRMIVLGLCTYLPLCWEMIFSAVYVRAKARTYLRCAGK